METQSLLIQNKKNYGIYSELIEKGFMNVYTGDLNIHNIDNHFESILNIFRDGIETDEVHHMFLYVTFTDNETVKLSVFYYFFNLIFWRLPLEYGDILTSEYLFYEEDLTPDCIKNYADIFIEKYQTKIDNTSINILIDNFIWKFKYIDEFHQYLLNTFNNEDTIELMENNKDFYDYNHADLSSVPIEKVKDVGMEIEDKIIEIIKNSDHCLKDAFRTGEGINVRQHKEYAINIGTKPNGTGSIYNHSINTSFVNGGLRNEDDLLVDSGAARIAQIYAKENVGDAGHFSRILGLNNQESRLHDNPNYVCNTQNLVKVKIKNKTILNRYKNRWYRFSPTSIELKMSSSPLRDNLDLIGKELYFRSPLTCSSAARGDGICYRCYGDLAHVNYSLSVGKIAAEILCSILTQMLLSSKHLLESLVIALEWNDEFNDIFSSEINLIVIKDNLENADDYKLKINLNKINYDNEHDQFDYNAHITSFDVIYPNGEEKSIYTKSEDLIYLSNDLLDIIYSMNKDDESSDGICIIPFEYLKNKSIFMIKLMNAELSRTLEKITSMIKSNNINGRLIEEVLEDLLDTTIEGRVNVDAVHLEVILSNQIRSIKDILDMPNWDIPNEQYQLIGLTKALTDNPSVTISLLYEKISKALYYPLNFKKKKSSSTDLFFMTQPHMLENIPDKYPKQPSKLFSKYEETDNEEYRY